MGFSPITGGGSITAHTHTNASGDGGALSVPDTLLGNSGLFGMMVALG
jgi:hypothetical protein